MAVSRPPGRAEDVPESRADSSATSIPLVGRVRERVNQELNARKERASEVIHELAGTVRRVGEPLHDEALGPLGNYADQAASRLDQLATRIRDRDVSEFADDLRVLARRRPATYAAAGFAAGFVLARFLRSSTPGRERTADRTPRGPRIPRATVAADRTR